MRFLLALIFSALITFTANAKTIDQKKEELKKIYEAGGISKVEYEKAIEFLEKDNEKVKKDKKKSFSLKSKNSKKKKLDLFKKKDDKKEKVTLEKIEKLGKPIKLDDTYFTEGMKKKFKGCNNSFSCRGKKAGSFMWDNFGKSSTWGQKYPGKMMQSMAMYEVFYASQLYEARKAIKRLKDDKYKESNIFFTKKKDEDKIRSLSGMNDGRKNMRKALGMTIETPTKEAIQKFWLLGEFLELGIPKNNKVSINEDIKDRQDKLDVYKATISTLKKKLEERAEQKKKLKTNYEKN